MRRLPLKNSTIVNISLTKNPSYSKVSSFSKLIRMICLILCFEISCNLAGVSFTKSRQFNSPPSLGIINMKKSAFNNWSSNEFKLSLRIRLWKVMRCGKITILLNMCLSSIQSSFTQVSLYVNLNRAGIPLISNWRHLYILSFPTTFLYSISLSVKRINESSPIRIFLIRALIGS